MPGDVQVTLRIDDDRGIDVAPRPEPEHLTVVRAAAKDVGDVPPFDEAAGVPEVRHAIVERHRAFDRDIVIADHVQELPVVAGNPHHDLRVHLHPVMRVVMTVQLDHVEPRVLAALQQVVADLKRCAVPVFVPHGVRHTGQGEHRPEDGRPRPVRRHDPEVAVARTSVVEGIPVGVGRRRALRKVGRLKVRTELLSGEPVDEVVGAVVRADADLDRAVRMLDHVGLTGPAGAAPRLHLASVRDPRVDREKAHLAFRRILPIDRRVARDGAFPVIVAARVPPEGGQSRERCVDRTLDRLGARLHGRNTRPEDVDGPDRRGEHVSPSLGCEARPNGSDPYGESHDHDGEGRH